MSVLQPTNLTTALISTGVRLTWNNAGNERGTEIWVSVSGGEYTLLTRVDQEIETYDDARMSFDEVKYKIRAVGGYEPSNYSSAKQAPEPLKFIFTSTGNGSGLGVFNLEVSENCTATIDGAGKFYTDLAGTQGESNTWNLTTTGSGFTGKLNRIYIKVPLGQATLKIKNVVLKWGEDISGGNVLNDGWDTYCYGDNSSLNCPSVSIDVATMTHNTSINVFGLNTIYGDLTGNSIMTYMEIADGTPNHTTPGHGGATCGGDLSLMPLTVFDCWDDTHFTGICTSANMQVIWCNGLNEVEFNLSEMPSLQILVVLAANSCNVVGNISLCPGLRFVQVLNTNSISGSIAGLTNLEYIIINNGNTITVPNITNVSKMGFLNIGGLVLTSANVNQILADLWANRDVARTYNFRTISLNEVGSGAPTGQGLTDLANLRAYRSPNNDPTKPLWTIDVIT